MNLSELTGLVGIEHVGSALVVKALVLSSVLIHYCIRAEPVSFNSYAGFVSRLT